MDEHYTEKKGIDGVVVQLFVLPDIQSLPANQSLILTLPFVTTHNYRCQFIITINLLFNKRAAEGGLLTKFPGHQYQYNEI
ncbi:MAG: hypothetical protein PHH97_02165 [Candidatus Cloacimonetes bacterium]|jgi:hypothetical protein|nr:hypothetical protein [Candidatus Cloacimonadota bacterium]HQP63173.1 hypothetical protein [Candidatus Cloacimonas sp.]